MLQQTREFDGRTYVLKKKYSTKKQAKAAASKYRQQGYYARVIETQVWVSRFPRFYYL